MDIFFCQDLREVGKEKWDTFIKNSNMGYSYLLYDFIIVPEYQEINYSFAILDARTKEIVMAIPIFLNAERVLFSRYGFALKNNLGRHYLIKLSTFFVEFISRLHSQLLVKDYQIEFCSLAEFNKPMNIESMINPAIFFGFEPSIRYTWLVDLKKKTNLILEDFEQTTRQAVRSFLNKDRYLFFAHSQTPLSAKVFLSMCNDTYKRSGGNPKSIEYLMHLLENLKDEYRDVYYIYDSLKKEVVVYAVVTFYNNTAHYCIGASNEAKASGVSKYLFYKIFLLLKKAGYEYFEMGGAYPYFYQENKMRGISDFKKCFGSFIHHIHRGTFVNRFPISN